MTIGAALPRLGLMSALSALVAWASMHRAFPDSSSVQHQIQSMGPWGPLGHIATARNIPLDELPSRLEELEPARHLGLTLVCRTDKRSAKAAALVRQAGFTDVVVLRGGMEEWNRHGFEVAYHA